MTGGRAMELFFNPSALVRSLAAIGVMLGWHSVLSFLASAEAAGRAKSSPPHVIV